MNTLHSRIIEISKKLHLAHLGSCLTSVDIIDEIYDTKKEEEKFVLSSGHAGLALYVVLEKYYGLDAEELFLKHGTHPKRDLQDRISCTTGSLGLGLSIALGMAIADQTKDVYCLISDGECFEGIIWESANVIQKYAVSNLKIYLNFNGWSAYDKIESGMFLSMHLLIPSMKVKFTNVEDYGFHGLSAHYITL